MGTRRAEAAESFRRSALGVGCPQLCRSWELPGRMSLTPKLPAPATQASLQAGPAATGRDGHLAGQPGISPVPSQRRSTAGRRVVLCSSSRPGAGRWHRTASRPPSSGCPVSPRSALRTGLSTVGRGRGGGGDGVSRGSRCDGNWDLLSGWGFF